MVEAAVEKDEVGGELDSPLPCWFVRGLCGVCVGQDEVGAARAASARDVCVCEHLVFSLDGYE